MIKRLPEPLQPLVGMLIILGMFALVGCLVKPPPPHGLALYTPPVVTSPTPEAERYVVFGDSTAEFFGRAMMSLDANILNMGLQRCPFRPDIHSGQVIKDGGSETFSGAAGGARKGQSCAWKDYMPGLASSIKGSTVILYVSPMQTVNFDDGHLPDVDFQLVLVRELNQWLDTVYAMEPKQVILVNEPRSRAWEAEGGRWWLEQDRADAWEAVLQVAHEVNPQTCYVDYGAWAATQPENRPDGSHMEGPGAVAAVKWVLEQCP